MHFSAMLLAACAALAFASAPAAAIAPAASSPQEVRLDHVTVVEAGAGPPVLLIPGLSTPREVWEGVAPELAKTHRVLSIQIDGFAGDATGPASDNLLATIVEELHSHLQRHKLAPVKIVGHSMGGLLGMMLAQKHPGDVAALMIVDALPFAGAMFEPNATADSVRPMAAMLRSRMEAGYHGAAGEAAAAATARGLAAKPRSVERVKGWVLRADPKVAAQAMAEDLTLDMRPALKAMRLPITVVHPASALGLDEAATAQFYRAQFAGARQVKFVAVPDSAHFIMLDQPETFLRIVTQFGAGGL